MITPKARQRLNSLAVLLTFLLSTLIPMGLIHASGSEGLVEPLNPSTQDIQDNNATLAVMNGDVYLRKLGEEAWSPVTETAWVLAGDAVKTGENGTAVLTFLDGTESLIDPDTEMTVTALQLNPEEPFLLQLKLWAGSTWHRITGFRMPGSIYKVETPSAILVARGTAWWVRVDPDGLTWVVVLEGHVDMQGEYTLISPEDLKPGDLGPNDAVRESFRRQGTFDSRQPVDTSWSDDPVWEPLHQEITFDTGQPVDPSWSDVPVPGQVPQEDDDPDSGANTQDTLTPENRGASSDNNNSHSGSKDNGPGKGCRCRRR